MKRFTAIATVALVMGTIVGCGGETTDTANAVQTEKIEKVELMPMGLSVSFKINVDDYNKKIKKSWKCFWFNINNANNYSFLRSIFR